MKFNIITIFPRLLDSYFADTLIKRAQDKKIISIQTHDLRDVTTDRHHTVDDSPYGGGPGMILKIEPIYKTLKKIKRLKKSKVILLEAAGQPLNQKLVKKLSAQDQLIFICGRYEGVDARVYKLVDERISLGPYVLAGGELPAAIIMEAVTRLLPGAIGKKESLVEESHNEEGFLEYPQYTRPDTFYPEPKNKKKIWKVPDVLLSGDHKKITDWRKKASKIKK